jgi:hypothetical protein
MAHVERFLVTVTKPDNSGESTTSEVEDMLTTGDVWLDDQCTVTVQHAWLTMTGRVMTDFEIEALSREAERGYELSKLIKLSYYAHDSKYGWVKGDDENEPES